MKAETAQRPRLKNLDDLFLLNDGVIPSIPSNIQPKPNVTRTESSVAIKSLTSFRGHPFRLYEGERLDDMVSSIKRNGVLIPIIVRMDKDRLEILSGHNRVHAASLAGLDRVPTIVLEKISDEEAWVYVIETNLMQRSFSDMSHSEKAAVISIQHSKMFSPGKRNDILAVLNALENPEIPHDIKRNVTFPQLGERLHSDKRVGEMYSLSKNTVARYLRIHQLAPELKSRLDNDEIPFIPAVDISFIRAEEQLLLDKCIGLNGFRVDMKKAGLLRQYSESGRLGEDNIYLILSGEINGIGKKRRSYSFKIKPKVYKKYFPEQLKTTEIEAIIEKALDLYYQHNTK